jgi:hypothetical protein
MTCVMQESSESIGLPQRNTRISIIGLYEYERATVISRVDREPWNWRSILVTFDCTA